MMNDARDHELQQLLQLSTQMLEAAQVADWERVAGLQSVCADRVHQAWPASMQTRDAFLLLQQHHASVLALTERAHEQVGRELSTLRESHRALNAYLETGSRH